MLTIRSEQMRRLANGLVKDFEQRLRRYLEWTYPELTTVLPDGGVVSFIARAREKCRVLDLRTEAEVARWAEILLVHGEDFGESERTSWARAILDDPDGTGTDKVSRIDSWLRAESTFQRPKQEAAHGG